MMAKTYTNLNFQNHHKKMNSIDNDQMQVIHPMGFIQYTKTAKGLFGLEHLALAYVDLMENYLDGTMKINCNRLRMEVILGCVLLLKSRVVSFGLIIHGTAMKY